MTKPAKIPGGYLALYRKIRENMLWLEPRRFSRAEAWIDILMEARHSLTPETLLIRGTKIVCGYAQSVRSLGTWAARWQWSIGAVRRFFKLLKSEHMIELENVTQTTRITVCKYASYDPKRRADSIGGGSADGSARDTRTVHKQEGKKVKNEEKNSAPQVEWHSGQFIVPPAIIAEYRARWPHVPPATIDQDIIDCAAYHLEKGTKIKAPRGRITTWLKNSFDKTKPQADDEAAINRAFAEAIPHVGGDDVPELMADLKAYRNVQGSDT